MTFKKKRLGSKVFITAYTERGIVIYEGIRVGNFSVSDSALKNNPSVFVNLINEIEGV
jgi:hypothetical protein